MDLKILNWRKTQHQKFQLYSSQIKWTERGLHTSFMQIFTPTQTEVSIKLPIYIVRKRDQHCSELYGFKNIQRQNEKEKKFIKSLSPFFGHADLSNTHKRFPSKKLTNKVV